MSEDTTILDKLTDLSDQVQELQEHSRAVGYFLETNNIELQNKLGIVGWYNNG